jgi:hypothetical protein
MFLIPLNLLTILFVLDTKDVSNFSFVKNIKFMPVE